MTAVDVCAAKPCGGSSLAIRCPSVRMIRHPPAYVPRAMAVAELALTQSGTVNGSAARCPDTISARAITPIVFCASFVPWVKATKPPERSWSLRKIRFTGAGARLRISQRMTVINAAAPMSPATGAASDGTSTFSFRPCQLTTAKPPVAATDEPMIPPTNAWLELDGIARYHVIRFHVIAPTSPAKTTLRVIAAGLTIPFAIVAATAKKKNAPTKLRIAELSTAILGDSACVDTLVAIEFAVSWNPFVKSKKRAVTMTAISVSSTQPASDVLDDDVPDQVGSRLTGVDRLLERFEDVLPPNDRQRVLRVLEEPRDALAHDPVALVLEPLDFDHVGLDPPQLLEVGESGCDVFRDLDEHLALLERGIEPRLDLVETEQVGRLVHVVDDVVDRLRQVVDVLAVEGGYVLSVEQLEGLARQLVPAGLERLDLGLADDVPWKLREAPLDEPRRLEQVVARTSEQVVERGRFRDER